MKLLAALLPIALLACRPDTASSYTFRDGSEGWALVCDSAEQCVNDARNTCDGPYEVMSSRGEDYVRTTSYGSSYANQWGFSSVSGSTVTKAGREVHLLIRCRKKP